MQINACQQQLLANNSQQCYELLAVRLQVALLLLMTRVHELVLVRKGIELALERIFKSIFEHRIYYYCV